MNEQYTHNDWVKENNEPQVNFAFRGYRIIYYARKLYCPKCGVIGFYGAFTSNNDPEYPMCKFCGIWQKIDEN